MTACRIRNSPIEAAMTFGRMTIAKGFLMPESFAKDDFFELTPDLRPHFSMQRLFDDFAQKILDTFVPAVEISE